MFSASLQQRRWGVLPVSGSKTARTSQEAGLRAPGMSSRIATYDSWLQFYPGALHLTAGVMTPSAHRFTSSNILRTCSSGGGGQGAFGSRAVCTPTCSATCRRQRGQGAARQEVAARWGAQCGLLTTTHHRAAACHHPGCCPRGRQRPSPRHLVARDALEDAVKWRGHVHAQRQVLRQGRWAAGQRWTRAGSKLHAWAVPAGGGTCRVCSELAVPATGFLG